MFKELHNKWQRYQSQHRGIAVHYPSASAPVNPASAAVALTVSSGGQSQILIDDSCEPGMFEESDEASSAVDSGLILRRWTGRMRLVKADFKSVTLRATKLGL